MATLLDALKSFFMFITDKNTNKVTRIATTGDLQVGLIDNPASFEMFGRLVMNCKLFVINGSSGLTINLSNHDTIVNIDSTGISPSTISVILPSAPRNGQIHVIKDYSGSCVFLGNIISITTHNPDIVTIENAPTKTITSGFGVMTFYWYGNQWYVMSCCAAGA